MSENNQQQTYQLDKLHEKLIELLWKIKGMGKIGDVIIRTVKETVTPQERIIACFYHLELDSLKRVLEYSQDEYEIKDSETGKILLPFPNDSPTPHLLIGKN